MPDEMRMPARQLRQEKSSLLIWVFIFILVSAAIAFFFFYKPILVDQIISTVSELLGLI